MSDNPPAQRAPAGQGKRNRPRKGLQPAPTAHLDGTVSDTVTTASPRSPRPARQQRQQPLQPAQAQANSRVRPVSVGGPMLHSHGATPGKEQAYAGSLFQASPAASKLPLPHKFFSKSVPDVAARGSLATVMDGEKTPEAMSSPEQDVVSPSKHAIEQARVKSPLDMFFNADKLERDRRASGSLSPATRKAMSPDVRTPFAQRSTAIRRLDDRAEPSPKTLVPPPRPHLGERPQSLPGAVVPQQSSGEDFSATTEALKAMLFKNVSQSPAQQTPQKAPQSPWASPSPLNSAPQIEERQNTALHYGNANLSPLFAEARNSSTPARPVQPQPYWQYNTPSPARSAGANQQIYAQSPSSFTRSYLDQHIRTSLPTAPPEALIGGSDRTFSQRPSSNGVTPSNENSAWKSPQQFPGAWNHNGNGAEIANGSSAPPPPATNRDVNDMSEDLRRILKLVR